MIRLDGGQIPLALLAFFAAQGALVVTAAAGDARSDKTRSRVLGWAFTLILLALTSAVAAELWGENWSRTWHARAELSRQGYHVTAIDGVYGGDVTVRIDGCDVRLRWARQWPRTRIGVYRRGEFRPLSHGQVQVIAEEACG